MFCKTFLYPKTWLFWRKELKYIYVEYIRFNFLEFDVWSVGTWRKNVLIAFITTLSRSYGGDTSHTHFSHSHDFPTFSCFMTDIWRKSVFRKYAKLCTDYPYKKINKKPGIKLLKCVYTFLNLLFIYAVWVKFLMNINTFEYYN